MWTCKLCEKNSVFTTHLCDKCLRVQHFLKLYHHRVYDVLENCLVSKEFAITAKEKREIRTTAMNASIANDSPRASGQPAKSLGDKSKSLS